MANARTTEGLYGALRDESRAGPALRALWEAGRPRRDLVCAALGGAAGALAELEVLLGASATPADLSACAAAAALERRRHAAARRVLLACASAAARRRRAMLAARIVAVVADGADTDTIVALVDAGFAKQAAVAAVKATGVPISDEDIPALLHALLLVVARLGDGDGVQRARVVAAGMRVASRAQASTTKRACLLAVRSAASEDHAVVDAVLELYERTILCAMEEEDMEENSDGLPVYRFSCMDVAFIFVLLSCGSGGGEEKKRVLEILHQLCLAPDGVFVPPVPSAAGSSSSAAALQSGRTTALLGALDVPGAEEWSALAVDVCDSLMRAPDATVQKTIAEVTGKLFTSHVKARPRILHYTLDALREDTNSAYGSLLRRLAESRGAAALFRSEVDVLAEWLRLLDAMPFDAAAGVLAALARIAATVPALADKLLVSVRKMDGERSRVARFLALGALINIATAPGATPPLFGEVAEMLGVAIHRHNLRVPALRLLAQAMREASPYARETRWRPVNTLLLEDVRGMQLDNGVRLANCFASCCGGLPARRDVPLLLSCVVTLRNTSNFPRLVVGQLEKYVEDIGAGAVVEACAPPLDLADNAQAKWVSTRTAMLLALCETLLPPLDLGVKGASSSTGTNSSTVSTRVALVYALSFVIRDSIPKNLRAKPVHERSCDVTSEGTTISARERCAHENLATSKLFRELDNAGTVDGVCGLRREECLDIQGVVSGVEEMAGKYVASVLRAEVFARWTDILIENEEFDYEVRRMATIAFCDTNPTSDSAVGNTVMEKPPLPRRKTRRSSLSTAGQTSTKRRKRTSLIVAGEARRRSAAMYSLSDGSSVTSAGDDVSEVSAEHSELDTLAQKIRFREARDAVANALRRRDEVCDTARLSLRSAAIALLLRTSTKDEYRASEWSFLVGSAGVVAGATAACRELVQLFEKDFRTGMTTALCNDYISLLAWFVQRDVASREQVANVAMSILSEYDIAQVRIVRGLFSLLLDSLASEACLPVLQESFRWLGEQQGVLAAEFKSERSMRFDSTFDIDIVEEAAALDGVDASQLDKRLYPRNVVDASEEEEDGNTRPTRRRNGQAGSTEGGVTASVKNLGLNDTEETCLACVQAALIRLEAVVPTNDKLRALEKEAVETLGGAVDALCALLGTQRGAGLTWARPVVRRASDAAAKVLGAADAALQGARGLSDGGEAFAGVLGLCARACREVLARPAGRALVAEGKARRAAAKLEMHVPAALADLAKVWRGEPMLDEVRNAWGELAGVEKVTPVPAPRKKARVRSRNRVVDTWLEEEDGEDDFADLEDFVCGMDERDL